jgi:hypothetical protein
MMGNGHPLRRRCLLGLLPAALGVALFAAALFATTRAPAKGGGEGGSEVAPPDLFSGFLVAANATEIFGPETSFRIRGWNSNWGHIKLLELAPDGEEIKAGEVIARFEFIGRDALEWVKDRLRKAEAAAAEAKIASTALVDDLRLEKRRRELEAALAAIDVEKEHAISRRQAELFRIRRQIAEFEVEAITARIAASEKAMRAQHAYQDATVARAEEDLGRYAFYEQRFVLKAPHDGVVRHAFNPEERRKIQKGDATSAGELVAYLAKDATLAAKFFVPEHRLAEVKVGGAVVVTTNTSAEEQHAVIKSIACFPQGLGFLMENEHLPNGMEKAFAVMAELAESPSGVSAGTEIRVKAKRP